MGETVGAKILLSLSHDTYDWHLGPLDEKMIHQIEIAPDSQFVGVPKGNRQQWLFETLKLGTTTVRAEGIPKCRPGPSPCDEPPMPFSLTVRVIVPTSTRP